MNTDLAMSVSTRFSAQRRHLDWTSAWMAAVVIAASLICACSSKDQQEAVPVVTVQAATVESKTIQAKVATDAILYPRDEAAIVPKVIAPIKKFYVQRGSEVRAGQLLAELENQDLLGAVTENQGGYDQAEAAYNSALQSASQDLQVAKEQLDAAQKLYDGRALLYKEGAIAAKDVEDARIALTQARNQYELVQKKYNLKAAAGQLTAAKGKTASAEAQLSYTKIVSPINGVVTDRPFYVGETPPSGSPILTVMDLSSVVARAYVSPQQAAELHVGDSAALLPGGGRPAIPGKVTVVSPALDPDSTTVQVWVQAPNPGGQLKPGSTVGVSIVAKTVKDAPVVPAEAVLTAPDGTTSVMVIGNDGLAHQTAVQAGIRDAGEVQIVSGLQEGEQVVTVGAYGLPDRTKVTISRSLGADGGTD
jgi:RND family efflux transporter MFP subunit